MQIFIPTRGRVFQETWTSLPPELADRVVFVIPWNQLESVVGSDRYCSLRTPVGVDGIGPTRQWILENTDEDKFVMLDDDLVFATRREDDPTKFSQSTPEEILGLFDSINLCLDKYAHVGVSTREGGNRDIDNFNYNCRLLRILAYRRDVLLSEGVRFDRIELMEDFDATLQLLRHGYPNVRINTMVHNQRSSNAPGGCSTYRTLERQSAAANRLAELHPSFVSVVTKKTKTAWNGQERQDVRIQWKQAFNRSAYEARTVTSVDKGA